MNLTFMEKTVLVFSAISAIAVIMHLCDVAYAKYVFIGAYIAIIIAIALQKWSEL